MLTTYGNMVVNTTSTKHRTAANVSCEPGYSFSDKHDFKEHVCNANGEWEPQIETCSGMLFTQFNSTYRFCT